MEKYTATAAEETTDAKPELVAHVAKTLDGVSTELAGDLVAGVKDADVIVLANDSASMGTAHRPRDGADRPGDLETCLKDTEHRGSGKHPPSS